MNALKVLFSSFLATVKPGFMAWWTHPVKKWYIIGIGSALILLLSWPFFSTDETVILTANVQEGEFRVSVTEPGEIRAANANTVLTPRVGWGAMTLTYLVPEGTTVNEGDVVAIFEPGETLKRQQDNESQLNILKADMEKAIAQDQSNREDAQANLESQILAFELSKLQLERSKFDAEMERRSAGLKYQQDSISLSRARQSLKSKQIVGQSDLSQIRLKIEQAQNALTSSTKELEKLTIKAPIPGLVVYEQNWSTDRKIEKGSQLWPNQPIMQLPDLSSMQSTTQINEVDISRIKKGQKVIIKLDAFPQFSYNGDVVDVASVGKSKGNNSSAKVFDVVIAISKQDSIMKPGMTTSNEIIIETLKSVLFTPIESVFEEDGLFYVYKKTTFGFSKTEVKTGSKNDNFIVITEGLSEGDEVSLSNPELSVNLPN